MSQFNTYLLKAGNILSLVTNAALAGSWEILEDGVNSPSAPTTLSVSTTTIVGPYQINKWIGVKNAVATQLFADFQGQIDSCAPAVGADALDDLANDATGTAIATAVNGIIAALVSAGILLEVE